MIQFMKIGSKLCSWTLLERANLYLQNSYCREQNFLQKCHKLPYCSYDSLSVQLELELWSGFCSIFLKVLHSFNAEIINGDLKLKSTRNSENSLIIMHSVETKV